MAKSIQAMAVAVGERPFRKASARVMCGSDQTSTQRCPVCSAWDRASVPQDSTGPADTAGDGEGLRSLEVGPVRQKVRGGKVLGHGVSNEKGRGHHSHHRRKLHRFPGAGGD